MLCTCPLRHSGSSLQSRAACCDTLAPLASVPFSRIALGLALALCPDRICLLGFHFFPISLFSPVLSSCLSSGVWRCKPFCPSGWAPRGPKVPSYTRESEAWDVLRCAAFLQFLFFLLQMNLGNSPKSLSSPFFLWPSSSVLFLHTLFGHWYFKNKISRTCKWPLTESLVCLWD